MNQQFYWNTDHYLICHEIFFIRDTGHKRNSCKPISPNISSSLQIVTHMSKILILICHKNIILPAYRRQMDTLVYIHMQAHTHAYKHTCIHNWVLCSCNGYFAYLMKLEYIYIIESMMLLSLFNILFSMLTWVSWFINN